MMPFSSAMFALGLLAVSQPAGDNPLTIPPPPPQGSPVGRESLDFWKQYKENPADPDQRALDAYKLLLTATMAANQQEMARLKAELLFNHPKSTFTRFVCFQEKWRGLQPLFVSRLKGHPAGPSPADIERVKAAIALATTLVPEQPHAEALPLFLVLDIPVSIDAESLTKYAKDGSATSKAIAGLAKLPAQPLERLGVMKFHVALDTVRPVAWNLITHRLTSAERENPDVMLCLARILMLENQPEEAAKVLEPLVSRAPSPEAQFLLGSIRLARGETDKAVESFQRAAVAGNPYCASAEKLLAATRQLHGSLAIMKQVLDKAVPRLVHGTANGIILKAQWPARQGGTRRLLMRMNPLDESFMLIIQREVGIDLAVETTRDKMRVLLAGDKEILELPASEGLVPIFALQQTDHNIGFQFNTTKSGKGDMTRSLANLANLPLLVSSEARSRMLDVILRQGYAPGSVLQDGDLLTATWLKANATNPDLMELAIELGAKDGRIGVRFGPTARIGLSVIDQDSRNNDPSEAWPDLPTRSVASLGADNFSRILGSLMGMAADAELIGKAAQ